VNPDGRAGATDALSPEQLTAMLSLRRIEELMAIVEIVVPVCEPFFRKSHSTGDHIPPLKTI
jgi:hypothetical protein